MCYAFVGASIQKKVRSGETDGGEFNRCALLLARTSMVSAALRHFFAGVAARSAEAAAAAAGADSLWIVDVEAAAHQVVDVVDARPIDIEKACRVDDDAQPMLFIDFIPLARQVKGHAVLHSAAAAAFDKDAQGVRFLQAFLFHDAT